MTERVPIELVLPIDRLPPPLRAKHPHRLLMGNLAQGIDGERLLAMRQRGRKILTFAVNARGVALHLEEHVAQPIAFRPAPIVLGVVGIVGGNVLGEITGVEPVGGLQADQRLVACA